MSDEVTRQAAEASAERDDWQRRAEAAERAKQQLADALQAAQQWISVSNGKINVLTAERDAARAEVEGLRADLLAHPPELYQELAIERKRHLELMEDYDRQNVLITTLEDAVKRAENALKVAQAKHIDDRLKGFLAVISQLADQAQELLP